MTLNTLSTFYFGSISGLWARFFDYSDSPITHIYYFVNILEEENIIPF